MKTNLVFRKEKGYQKSRLPASLIPGVLILVWMFTAAFGQEVSVFDRGDQVITGTSPENPVSPQSICGTEDERESSGHPAIGRLLQPAPGLGCTAWIAPNGLLVAAGHCFDYAGTYTLEFNVPPSLPDGTIQHPPEEDRYIVDPASIVKATNGIGDDWAVFAVFDNGITGLQPIEAQGASIAVVQDLNPPNLRVTGYGFDGPPPYFGNFPPYNEDSQTQQSDARSNNGSSSTTLRYVIDTQIGNSGSPVIVKKN